MWNVFDRYSSKTYVIFIKRIPRSFRNCVFLASEGPSTRINVSQKGLRKVTSGLWGTLDEFIVTGHDNGELVQWDIKVDSWFG